MGGRRPSISFHQCLPATKLYDVKITKITKINYFLTSL